MIVILDTYNILKTMHSAKFISPRIAQRFVQQVLGRAERRGYQVYIVFDGSDHGVPAKQSRSDTTRTRGIVMYAGNQLTADDLICNLAEQLQGNEVVVVTADRALRSTTSKLGAKLLEPAVFWRILYQDDRESIPAKLHSRSDITPLHQTACSELAELLADTPANSYLKQEAEEPERIRTGHAASKAEKRLARIVERL